MRKFLFIVLLPLAGCSLAPTIYRDPVSGKVDQCKASTAVMAGMVGHSEIQSCSEAYERMGWQKQ